MNEEKNHFDFIMNLGSSQEGFILVAGPFVILSLFTIFFIFWTLRDRKSKSEEMGKLVDDLSKDFDKVSDLDIIKPRPSTSEIENQQKEPSAVAEVQNLSREGWLKKLKSGLGKTSSSLQGGLVNLFTGKSKIDEETLERLHETLYRADMGAQTADRLVDHVRNTLKKEETGNWEQVKNALKSEIKNILEAPQKEVASPQGPLVIMIVGVNGVGKTTTIGKLAAHYLAQNKSVLLCAADTFRAAAIDQLKVWGDRVGVHVVAHQQGSDPAAVAFDAVKAANARKSDVLLVDTAGRLHNKNDLMDELAKIARVMKKEIPDAPHETWLVIDSTTGQNGAVQVKAFKEVTDLSGLVVTKLDGTAKGGIIIGVSDQYHIPVKYIGVGEQINDLRPFDPSDFANALFDDV